MLSRFLSQGNYVLYYIKLNN